MWLLSSLLSFVVTLNLAVKDGLGVIFMWTLNEKKDCCYTELDSEGGQDFFTVLERMWNGFCNRCLGLEILCSG